ncbi:hypothetical protein MmiAt1_01780 [Methanimicrococcus sp. At1]|uniref:Uncharacterized protein n=1 Tax=Methanimicrococcus hacksteinii TaxID=3028293 RepID=A0ABU3VML6_9EURY|nr:hypothetical protein [Methanimicrococcus sp. At1]MDV0444646.1 hypothetical protein [Methanimicrococcus sp. At1]
MTKLINNKNVAIRHLFVLVILISLISPALAGATDTESYFSESYIQEIINNTPAPDSVLFEQAKKDSNTVAAAGNIPVLLPGRESYEWFVLLQGTVKKINDENQLDPHLWDNGGFIIGYGCHHSYVQVYVSGTYSDEDINKVIRIVQDAGKAYGIDDVPLIIVIDEHAQGFDNTPAGSGEPAKTIPGVGLGASAFLALFVVLCINKFKK